MKLKFSLLLVLAFAFFTSTAQKTATAKDANGNTYTYYSNGGIYLVSFSVKNKIPKNTFYNATDLMEELIQENSLSHYIHKGYWLDIGKPQDFEQSQFDIKKLNL